jgi:hypothetical protein
MATHTGTFRPSGLLAAYLSGHRSASLAAVIGDVCPCLIAGNHRPTSCSDSRSHGRRLAGRATLSDWKRLISTWVSPVGIARYRMGRNGLGRIDASPAEGRAPPLGVLDKSSARPVFLATEGVAERTVVPIWRDPPRPTAVIRRWRSACTL